MRITNHAVLLFTRFNNILQQDVRLLSPVVAPLVAAAAHVGLVRVLAAVLPVLALREAVALALVLGRLVLRGRLRGRLPVPARRVRAVGAVRRGGRRARRGRRRRRLRLAHVHLLVEQHTELAHLLDVPRLAGVERERGAPQRRVAAREAHDVAGLQQRAGLVPHGQVHGRGRVGHAQRAHLALLLGQRRGPHLQHYEHRVDALHARLKVFYLDVLEVAHVGYL